MNEFPLAAERRRAELGMVVMAALITAGAYTLAALGKNAQMPARIIPFLVALLGLLLCAHLGVRALARGADATLLPLAVLLNGVGYVVIARLSERLAGLQTTWTFISIVAFLLTLMFVRRPADLARYKWTFLVVGVVYDRMHSREIATYGGLVHRMPFYATVMLIFTMGNVGLPGTCGFIGEFLTLLGSRIANSSKKSPTLRYIFF